MMKIDTSGWADVAGSHGHTVFLAARELAGDDDSAWDCVQDAFATALSRGVAEVEEPVSWLCGVARNHARNLRRSRRRWWNFLERLAHRRPPVAATSAATHEDGLSRALSRLPAAQREAVVLRYLGEMSFTEVAAAQRVSAGAAKARVHRGLARLRRTLGTSALLLALVRTATAAARRKEALLATARAGAATALTAATAARFLLPFLLVAAAYVAFNHTPGRAPPAPADETLMASFIPVGAPPLKAPVAAAVKTNRIVFRDLCDGSPLPEFEVKFGSRTWTSGVDGAIEIAPIMASVAPVAVGWVLGGKPNEVLLKGGNLWFGRKIRIRGRVTVPADSDLPITEVSISWKFKDGNRSWSKAGRDKLWSKAWTAMHLLDRSRRPVRAGPDGSFEIHAFALRDLYVRAHAPKWMAAVADVPCTKNGDPDEVALAIRDRAIRLHGMLRGRNGEPMRNLPISATVIQRMSGEEYARSYFPLPGHGLTSRVGAKGAIVNHLAGGRTGPHGNLGPGQFEIYLGIPGEILITAYPPGGYAPLEHRITRGIGDDGRVRLMLDWVGEDAAVTLTSGGIPIAPGEATVLDFSVDGKQTNFRLPIGKGGRMPTALLTKGHRYRMDFRASPHPIRYFEWEPVDRLEIDDLPFKMPVSPPWQRTMNGGEK